MKMKGDNSKSYISGIVLGAETVVGVRSAASSSWAIKLAFASSKIASSVSS
jgi:hypothetical protein